MLPYLFTSQRLGFRGWADADIPLMAAISGDAEVMRFFPAVATPQQTHDFVRRMQQMQQEKGYCYYAVDRLEDGAFIGFIGLFWQEYDAAFTPCTDVGWRLAKAYWNKGYATEGAIRCLQHAHDTLQLPTIYATAPAINLPSIHVMQKAGMQHHTDFIHPRLANDARLRNCVAYISKK